MDIQVERIEKGNKSESSLENKPWNYLIDRNENARSCTNVWR